MGPGLTLLGPGLTLLGPGLTLLGPGLTLLGPGLTLLGPGLTLAGPWLTLLGAPSEVNTSSDVLVAHEFSWSVKGVCLVVGGAAAKTTAQRQETE